MLQQLSHRCLIFVDRGYQWIHALEPVGPLLLVGRRRHWGPARCFDDGTVLSAGEWIGTLHLRNSRLAGLVREASRHSAGWRFAAHMRASLAALAHYSAASHGEALVAFNGTTWMKPHGLGVGFSCDPLQDGWRRRLLELHFRWLRHGFAPAAFRGVRRPLEPRDFWITSAALRLHFGGPPGECADP